MLPGEAESPIIKVRNTHREKLLNELSAAGITAFQEKCRNNFIIGSSSSFELIGFLNY